MIKFYSFLLLSCALFSLSWRDLNPFASEIIEHITSQEYACNSQPLICLEGKAEVDVNTWKHDRVMVQIKRSGTREILKETKILVEHDLTHLTITSDDKIPQEARIYYTLMIPEKSQLRVRVQDSIKVRNAMQSVHLISSEGNIKVLHANHSVWAQAQKGKVTVKQRTLPSDASLFIDAYKNARLVVSHNHNAHFHVKSPHTIQVELFVTLTPCISKINAQMWNRLMHDVEFTLGDGGPSIMIESRKGQVIITEQ